LPLIPRTFTSGRLETRGLPSRSGAGCIMNESMGETSEKPRVRVRGSAAIGPQNAPSIEEIRRAVSTQLDPSRRVELGQFMTPWAIARFMASLFRSWPKEVKLLDPGAGLPTRCAVQQAMPQWLVIGATTYWSAMASFHSEGLGCARCLHNEDEPGDGPIPTTACVSFWAGLLTAAYLRAMRQARPSLLTNSKCRIAG
jgi:hypothetical protein